MLPRFSKLEKVIVHIEEEDGSIIIDEIATIINVHIRDERLYSTDSYDIMLESGDLIVGVLPVHIMRLN